MASQSYRRLPGNRPRFLATGDYRLVEKQLDVEGLRYVPVGSDLVDADVARTWARPSPDGPRAAVDPGMALVSLAEIWKTLSLVAFQNCFRAGVGPHPVQPPQPAPAPPPFEAGTQRPESVGPSHSVISISLIIFYDPPLNRRHGLPIRCANVRE